ncbi:T9SS type A sorting domain-containing protein [Hymenobacter sp. BRD67]|uniref:T9SS type A sorting domain-containing protein n=1 Tax=Hymenobacter sp. BRD67 TaxID=2675877 RepID=UPI001564EDA4|nr:T9SS type A sorting domain-containing protein [Hymenobacter sp. BRD67]QKG54450.1 T9SS type A sorting domain-containing protein [Hymenobacter sp. BRD67]
MGFIGTGSQYALLRVLPSGTFDNAFANPVVQNSSTPTAYPYPQGLLVQPDGKILVYGAFTSFGGAARNGLVRFKADGTVDNSFVPPVGTLPRRVSSVALQASGKLVITYDELVAGSLFATTGAGTVLARLNTDGSLDNTFATGTGPNAGDYFTVLAQPDGRLLINGVSSFNGQAAPYSILRLTADGAVDNTFNQLATRYSIVLVQPDGYILANTNVYGGTTGVYGDAKLVRLNSNGGLDGTFAPISTPANIFTGDNAFNGYLYQPADGKIIAYGSFTSVLGQVRGGIVRLIPGTVTATLSATAAQALVVYPNPARQQLTVVLPALTQPTQATLLSLTGQVLRQWALPARQAEASLDLSTVAAGIYVLRIPGPMGMYQQKVVVEP